MPSLPSLSLAAVGASARPRRARDRFARRAVTGGLAGFCRRVYCVAPRSRAQGVSAGGRLALGSELPSQRGPQY
eukprot:3980942-Lingulodinium_polyedra.AAC.1